MKSVFCILLTAALLPAVYASEPMAEEIDYLIASVGRNGCSFIRNGRRYSGRDARYHLESKRRRNAHLFDSTEEFIERIASKSVTTAKPYLISCRGKERQTAREWFMALLAQYRNPMERPPR